MYCATMQHMVQHHLQYLSLSIIKWWAAGSRLARMEYGPAATLFLFLFCKNTTAPSYVTPKRWQTVKMNGVGGNGCIFQQKKWKFPAHKQSNLPRSRVRLGPISKVRSPKTKSSRGSGIPGQQPTPSNHRLWIWIPNRSISNFSNHPSNS